MAAGGRRVVSLWLPRFPTDRIIREKSRGEPIPPPPSGRRRTGPLALSVKEAGRLIAAATDRRAEAAGVHPGMALTDARALAPGLKVLPFDGRADARALAALADWCRRYSPVTATDGRNGLWLDIAGAAHLFGGEEALIEDLLGRIRTFGFEARAAVADAPGTAWALARHGAGALTILPSGLTPGGVGRAIAGLPVAALRLDPVTVAELDRLGLRRIGDLCRLARADLARRFAAALTARLDQALGRTFEPISPRRRGAPWRARMTFAEPIGNADDIALAARRLVERLSALLAPRARGARRLRLSFFRIDGVAERVTIGTSRPVRDPDYLMRLFAERLERVNAGPGIDAAMIEATVVEALAPAQDELDGLTPPGGGRDGSEARAPHIRDPLAPLTDKLANRLGEGNVVRLMPYDSHLPERAFTIAEAANGSAGAVSGAGANPPPLTPRPLRLLAHPAPIEAMALVPDDPPVLFRWRRTTHRVRRADGPERIALEWWRGDAWRRGDGGAGPDFSAEIRDYYRVEDSGGRRFWIYREGTYGPERPVRWFLHGLFP
ncbi:MAG: DNA polymerase Y family protein [Alphaproteobacteria bacterium]|nr:MAG: DNA polymerase Y family protein [Alphaproteobacteria bacterium]